jgi:hypothetical protein
MAYVLKQLYKQKPSLVAEAVADLLAMPGVLADDELSWPMVLERWPQTIPSLGDAIVAAAASQEQYETRSPPSTTRSERNSPGKARPPTGRIDGRKRRPWRRSDARR